TPGSEVSVKVGGIILTATADADGNWSVIPDTDIPDGAYTVEVTASIDGETSTPVIKEITIDTATQSPTVTITAPTGTVTTGKPAFTGTATPGSEVSVKVGGIILTATADADGNWSVIPDTDIPDGAYMVEVTASIDGETSTPVIKEITIDTATQSPTVTITAPTGTVTTGKPAFTGTATPGSEVSVKVGDIILTATADADGNWSVIPDTDIPDGAYTVEVTASIDGETSTPVTKEITINTKTPPVLTPGLGSLVPSQGALSPSFSSEVTNYTMNVGYATSHLSFLATPITPGASVTTTVNGQLGTLAQIPLQVGENIIVITVADGNGNVRHYTIKVYREAYTGGGNSGGGGTWTPDPTPPTTNPGTTTTKIQVALEIDGDNPLEKTTVEIERTKHVNGEVTDFVNLTQAQALEAVEKAKQIGNSIARIVIPDVKDEVDKVTVEIPKQSLHTLRDNGLSLEISTVNGHIAIPQSSMASIDDNFYFRLVPVKKESERQAIEERAKVEKVVRETLQSNDVRVVARPMTIETNMPSRPVQVTLPLRDVKVPTEAAARQVFLEQLAVFIEHSDGEKVVVFPDVVTMANGELGLRFTVEKFSTFTIIQFDKQEVEQPEIDEHEVYIKGFPNGTFGPDKNVTRAQVAIMMARILGYTEGQALNKAPFKDVAKNHSAAGAITFVKEQGIMNGDQNGNFHANANITRAEMAAVVANYKQLYVEEGVAITFKDTNGHWAQWIIEANRAAGIINGLENGSFAPNAALTRAQAVVMMNRMFERGPLHGVTKPSFPDVKATHWAFNEIEEAANSHSYLIDEDGKEQLSK
ncbi:S-layer homology domain-containing protein, partial [Lysinibacillus capsici]|uniref:S-layer homology domain-containing protein n=1 Tax=Lysinibacillus capsici TaxID=2115968 RepID=UPI0021521B4D